MQAATHSVHHSVHHCLLINNQELGTSVWEGIPQGTLLCKKPHTPSPFIQALLSQKGIISTNASGYQTGNGPKQALTDLLQQLQQLYSSAANSEQGISEPDAGLHAPASQDSSLLTKVSSLLAAEKYEEALQAYLQV